MDIVRARVTRPEHLAALRNRADELTMALRAADADVSSRRAASAALLATLRALIDDVERLDRWVEEAGPHVPDNAETLRVRLPQQLQAEIER